MTASELLLKKYLLAVCVTSRCWMLFCVASTIVMDKLLHDLMKRFTAVSFLLRFG